MAERRNRAVSFLVATFILAAALTLAQENKHPVATIVPPAKFDATPTPTQATTQATAPPTTNATTQATTAPTTNATTQATTPATTNATTQATTPATTNATAPPTTNATAPPTTNATAPPTTNATTTQATTTTVPGPTMHTNLTQGDYKVTENNQTCIELKAAIQIQVNNSKVQDTFIVQPGLTNCYGMCQDAKNHQLVLNFTEGLIVLGFLKNETTKMVYANYVAVNLTYAFTSAGKTSISKVNDSVQLFSMSAGHSYSCKSEMVYMGDGITLEFSQERLQAFDFAQNGQFGEVDLCKADQPNYNVAIAVGIVLIVLIVIVVIAYLVSRRKRTDGYQTL